MPVGPSAGYTSCVTATASWNGSLPQSRVVYLVLPFARLGWPGGGGDTSVPDSSLRVWRAWISFTLCEDFRACARAEAAMGPDEAARALDVMLKTAPTIRRNDA